MWKLDNAPGCCTLSAPLLLRHGINAEYITFVKSMILVCNDCLGIGVNGGSCQVDELLIRGCQYYFIPNS